MKYRHAGPCIHKNQKTRCASVEAGTWSFNMRWLGATLKLSGKACTYLYSSYEPGAASK